MASQPPGRPELKLAPKPPDGRLTRKYLIELVQHFWRHYRALTPQDSVGCAIAYCSLHYIPRGTSLDNAQGLPGQVIGEFVRLTPDLMQDAGFVPTLFYAKPLLPEIPLRLFHAWSSVFDSTKKPRDTREETLKALWIVEIVPHTITREEESRLLEKAARLAKVWADGDDVRSELWSTALPTKVMYRRKDGSFRFDIRALKDVLRRPEIRDLLGPISGKVRARTRGPDGELSEKLVRVRASSLDARAPEGDTFANRLRSSEPAPLASIESAELVAIVRKIIEAGRESGHAVDAAVEYLLGNRTRAVVAHECGITSKKLRLAEKWLADQLSPKLST